MFITPNSNAQTSVATLFQNSRFGIAVKRGPAWFFVRSNAIKQFQFRKNDEIFSQDFLTLNFMGNQFHIMGTAIFVPIRTLELITIGNHNNKLKIQDDLYVSDNINEKTLKCIEKDHLSIWCVHEKNEIHVSIIGSCQQSNGGIYLVREQQLSLLSKDEISHLKTGDTIVLGTKTSLDFNKKPDFVCVKDTIPEKKASNLQIKKIPNNPTFFKKNDQPIFYHFLNKSILSMNNLVHEIFDKFKILVIQRENTFYKLTTLNEVDNFEFHPLDRIYTSLFNGFSLPLLMCLSNGKLLILPMLPSTDFDLMLDNLSEITKNPSFPSEKDIDLNSRPFETLSTQSILELSMEDPIKSKAETLNEESTSFAQKQEISLAEENSRILQIPQSIVMPHVTENFFTKEDHNHELVSNNSNTIERMLFKKRGHTFTFDEIPFNTTYSSIQNDDQPQYRLGLGFCSSEENPEDHIVEFLLEIKENNQALYLGPLKGILDIIPKLSILENSILKSYLQKLDIDNFKNTLYQIQKSLLNVLGIPHIELVTTSVPLDKKHFNTILPLLENEVKSNDCFIFDMTYEYKKLFVEPINFKPIFSKIQKTSKPFSSAALHSTKVIDYHQSNNYSLNQLRKIASNKIISTSSQSIDLEEKCNFHVQRLGQKPNYLQNEHLLDELKTEQSIIMTDYEKIKETPHMVKIDSLKVPVYPYQEMGIKRSWACVQRGFGVLIADDMGLGKTIQTIALINMTLAKEGYKQKALVILPKSVIGNWEKEITRFSDLKICTYTGKKTNETEFAQANVVLCTYDKFVRDYFVLTTAELIKILNTINKQYGNNFAVTTEYAQCVLDNLHYLGYLDNGKITAKIKGEYNRINKIFATQKICDRFHQEDLLKKLIKIRNSQTLLDSQPFCMCVLDEAHRIKNEYTNRTQTLRNFQTKYKVILSGTPIHNGLSDLHSLMTFINPNLLGSLADFNKNFVNPTLSAIKEIESWVGQGGNYKHFSEIHAVKYAQKQFDVLRNTISPFIVRRLKSDDTILQQIRLCSEKEIPQLSLNHKVISYKLSNEQQALINYLYDTNKQNIGKALNTKSAFATDKKSKGFEILLTIQQVLDHPQILKKNIINNFIESCNLAGDGPGYSIKAVQGTLQGMLNQSNNIRSGKLDALVETISPIIKGGEKVVISVRFVAIAKMMQAQFRDKLHEEAHYLYGQCTQEQRQRMIDIFMGKIKHIDVDALRDILNAVGSEIFEEDLKNWLFENNLINIKDTPQPKTIWDKQSFPSEYLPYKNALMHTLFSQKKSLKKALKELKQNYVACGMAKRQQILAAITASTNSKNIAVAKISPKDISLEYQPVVDRINSLFSSKLFIVNFKAGGEGINLQSANHVILFDPSWNPSDNDQVIARAYRIGQQKPVTVYRMDTDGDLTEKRILKKAELKTWLANVILSPIRNYDKFFEQIYNRLLEENDVVAELEEIQIDHQINEVIIEEKIKRSALLQSREQKQTASENSNPSLLERLDSILGTPPIPVFNPVISYVPPLNFGAQTLNQQNQLNNVPDLFEALQNGLRLSIDEDDFLNFDFSFI